MALTPQQIQEYRTKYGIVPQTQGLVTQPDANSRIKDINDRIAKLKVGSSTAPDNGGDASATKPDPAIEAAKELGSNFMDRGKNVIDAVKRPADIAAKGGSKTDVAIAVGEAGLRTVGEVAGGAFDIINAGLKALTPEPIKNALSHMVDGLAKQYDENPDSLAHKVVGAWNAFTDKHPEAAKDLGAAFNIASLVTGGASEGAAKDAAEATVKAAGEVAGKAAGALESSAKASIDATQQSFLHDLVRPVQTKAVREAEVARSTEAGKGIFKRTIIGPSPEETRAIEAVSTIPGVNPKNTMQQNFQVIRDANVKEAVDLKTTLQKNDFAYSKEALLKELDAAKTKLADNPALTGDAGATAEKILAKARTLIAEKPPTGSSILDVRKELDQFVRSQKGDAAFDPAKENAFSIGNREVRTTLNNFLDKEAERMGVPASVKESLHKQSALYDALDNIRPKAAIEADTAIGRAFQNMASAVGIKNKIVQQIAAIAGIGGLGAAATFAPAAAAVGVGGFLVYKAGALILKPELRLAFAKLLRTVETASGATPELKQASTFIEDLIKDPSTDITERKLLPAPKTIFAEPPKPAESVVTQAEKDKFAADRAAVEAQNNQDIFNFNREKEIKAANEIRDQLTKSGKRGDFERLTQRFKNFDTWNKFVESNPQFKKKISSLGTDARGLWDIVHKK